MSETPNLDLPLIAAAQAQKHVTHNESLLVLDALVHLSVLSRRWTAPPPSPSDGDRYLVPVSATGAWAGWDGDLAAFQAGAWRRHRSRVGWVSWVSDEAALFVRDEAGWSPLTAVSGHQIESLGINARADEHNRLVVSSDAALFNHAGSGTQVKVNKKQADDTVSVMFQTDFSGRAELGLSGDDDLRIKVSTDGATWREAMRVDATSGVVTMMQPEVFLAHGTYGAAITMRILEEGLYLRGDTVESAARIPAGALVLAVSLRITETVTGVSSFDCGVSGQPARFGSVANRRAGVTHVGSVAPVPSDVSEGVRLTARGGSFLTGHVRLAIHYLACRAPWS